MMQDDRYMAMLQKSLTEYLRAPAVPPVLARAMRYSLQAGGKRLRPRMTLAACEMLGGDAQVALPLACAMEMIHTYSLIHDDLPCMDNDDYRRGQLTNHKVFGEGFAVLAGDGLLSYAFEVMLEAALRYGTAIPTYLRGVYAVAKGAGVRGMVAGQAADLENEQAEKADAETLVYIHAHKTGALLEAALLAGGYAAGATSRQAAGLSAFGETYGLLFQITDDILDVTGNEATVGKTLGKDATYDKLTYIKIYGLDGAREKAAEAARRAHETLEVFGSTAEYFHALIDDTRWREH